MEILFGEVGWYLTYRLIQYLWMISFPGGFASSESSTPPFARITLVEGTFDLSQGTRVMAPTMGALPSLRTIRLARPCRFA